MDKLAFVLSYTCGQEYQLSKRSKEIVKSIMEQIEEELEEEKQFEAIFGLIKNAVASANNRNKSLLLNMVQSGGFTSGDLLYIEEEDFQGFSRD